jgi:hypothetical protein
LSSKRKLSRLCFLISKFTCLIRILNFAFQRENDEFLGDRAAAAVEAVDWIDQMSASSDADIVIYAGDFNTESGDLPHRILTKLGKFDDSRLRFLPTFDDSRNTYRSSPSARPIAIDYVMHKAVKGKKADTVTLAISNPLTARVEGKNIRQDALQLIIIPQCLKTRISNGKQFSQAKFMAPTVLRLQLPPFRAVLTGFAKRFFVNYLSFSWEMYGYRCLVELSQNTVTEIGKSRTCYYSENGAKNRRPAVLLTLLLSLALLCVAMQCRE